MNDNFSFAALEDNVPSLSLDYPGVLRAWAQLGGDIDLQDVSPGTSLSDSIEKWNGVSDTKFLDDELKMSSASSPIANSSSSGFGTGSQAPAPSCICSYPCTHQKNCFGSMPERAAKSPLMGPIRPMHGRVPPLSTQDQDILGSSIKPSMCSGMIPHIGSPHSYLPMEPFPMGKMDCQGMSRPMVPVSSIPNMKQVAGSPFGGLTSMPSPQQPIKHCPDEPYTAQYIPVGDVVASKAATSCNLTAAVSLPCPLQKAPSNVVPCSTESVGHNRAQAEGTQDKSKSRNTSPMQLRIQLEEMKGWKGRFRTRKQSLDRYMEKKARRLQTKKIRYELRKINADRRPRIKGRFAKKEQFEEYMKNQRAEIEC